MRRVKMTKEVFVECKGCGGDGLIPGCSYGRTCSHCNGRGEKRVENLVYSYTEEGVNNERSDK